MSLDFISSMQGLFGHSNAGDSRTHYRIEDVRQAMLDSIGDEGCTVFPQIERRILFAEDLNGLWYLRSDVMLSISSLKGEVVASQKIRQITSMFEGLLPKGLFSRPGSMGS